MNPDRLRQLYRQSAGHRPDAGPCALAPEEMLAVLQGTAAPADRERVLSVIATHPACKEEFDLLRAVVLAGAAPRRSVFRAPWALAAMLVVGLWLGALVLLRGPNPAPAYRGDGDSLILVAPVGVMAEGDVALTWRPVHEAWVYEVTVVSEGDATRWRGSTADTTLVLPDSLLRAGTGFRWWVAARLPDGRSLRSGSAAVRWR
jgi:hypothetical protein